MYPLDELRLRQMFSGLFSPQVGNDLPSQGGITGNMYPSMKDVFGASMKNPVNPIMNSQGSDQFPINAPSLIGDNSDQDLYSRVEKMFPMEHDATDLLKQQLDAIPQRSNYKPGKLHGILSAIAAVGGSAGPAEYYGGNPVGFKFNPEAANKTYNSMIDEPYNEAVEDWKLREKPLEDLSTAERYINSNTRIARNNYLQDESRRQADETRRRGQDISLQKTQEALAQRDRFRVYKQYVAEHPNHKYLADRDGYMYSVDPQTNKVEYLTTPSGDYVTAKDLPPEELLRIKKENSLAEIEARGGQQRQNIAAQGGETRQNIEATGEQQRETAETKGSETRKTNREKTTSISGVNFGLGKGGKRRVILQGPNGTRKSVDEDKLVQAQKDNPTWKVVGYE